ncbi:DYW domain-containing protein [Plasmodiophora brassicae]
MHAVLRWRPRRGVRAVAAPSPSVAPMLPGMFQEFVGNANVPLAARILRYESDPVRGWAVFRRVLDGRLAPRAPFFTRMFQFCHRCLPSKAPDVLYAAVRLGVDVDHAMFVRCLDACMAAPDPTLLDAALDLYRRYGPRTRVVICQLAGLCRACGQPERALFLLSDAISHGVEVNEVMLSLFAACSAEAQTPLAGDVAESIVALAASDRVPVCRNQPLYTNVAKALLSQRRFANAVSLLRLLETKDIAPSEHTYAVVIGALAKADRTDQAMDTFSSMSRRGLRLHAPVLTTLIGACSTLTHLNTLYRYARAISPLLDNAFIVSAFAASYGRCRQPGSVHELYQVALDRNLMGNACVASALASAFGQCRDPAAAERVLSESNVDGIAPSVFACVVAGYGRRSRLADLHRLQSRLPLSDPFIASAFLSAYGRCGDLRSVQHIHRVVRDRPGCDVDVGVVSAIVAGYALCGDASTAADVFMANASRGSPSSFAAVVSSYGRLSRLSDIKRLHAYAGDDPNSSLLDKASVVSAFIAAYGQCGDLASVQAVYQMARDRGLLSHVDVVSALASAYGQCGDVASAERALLVHCDCRATPPAAFASIVASYGRVARLPDTHRLRRYAEENALLLNPFVISAFASAYSACADLSSVVSLYQRASTTALLTHSKVVSAFIAAFADCGQMAIAERVFRDYGTTPDVPACTSMMGAYARTGMLSQATSLFEDMKAAGLAPDADTLLALLTACSHVGDLSLADTIVSEFRTQWQIEPDRRHTACMIDLHSRAGRLDEAERQALSRPGTTVASWMTLLNACGRYRDVLRAQRVFTTIRRLVPVHARCSASLLAEAFSTMSEVYTASTGYLPSLQRLDDDREVRGLCQPVQGHTALLLPDRTVRFRSGDQTYASDPGLKAAIGRLLQELAGDPRCPHGADVASAVDGSHGEIAAVAYGLQESPAGVPICARKDYRVCPASHDAVKRISALHGRDIYIRDAHRHHHFHDGQCSCRDFW